MEPKAYSSFSLAWFVLLAISLHLLLRETPFTYISYHEEQNQESDSKKNEIIVEKYDEKNRPVVQTSPNEDSGKTQDQKARFFGQFRNRVEKETKARKQGKFSGQRSPPKGQDGSERLPEISDLMVSPSSPNALPGDIAEADQTFLNTDKVLYASFMNRISDEVYDPWRSHIQEVLTSFWRAGKKLEPNVYVTKLGITLNQDGKITSIQIVKSSGIPELDEAPKKALWETEPFPHPPAQMFDKSGAIQFGYEFHFEYQTSSFNIIPWAI